jgi:hypothetical protein
MNPRVRFAFTNLVAEAASVTASSEQASFPATNALAPQRPFLPWRSAALGVQTIEFDLGAAADLGLIFLNRTNFTAATISGSGGTGSFSIACTIGANPITGRYQHAIIPTASVPFHCRTITVSIAAQTPTDGGGSYLLGGVWAGAALTPPQNFTFQIEYDRIEPKTAVQAEHRGWQQRLVRGEPIARLTTRRVTRVQDFPRVMINDHLRAWFLLDRYMDEAEIFALYLNNEDPSQAYVCRRVTDARWSHYRQRLAQGGFAIEEVVGP